MLQFWQWLDQTSFGIRQSLCLFPAIETVHLPGMAAFPGTIGILDLRLLGWGRTAASSLAIGGTIHSLGLGCVLCAGQYRCAAVFL